MATNTPALIAFYSPAPQMGKTTATRFLTEGLGYKIVKFAAPVKTITATFLLEIGVPKDEVDDFLDGHRKEESLAAYGFDHLTSRYIQQVVGTDLGRRKLDPNIWTTVAGRKVRNLLDRGERVVMDDMRFPNEYDMVKQMGGECWCIYNPRVPIPVSDHPSEGLLSNHSFNVALINDGTIEDLERQILDHITRF
mgnify:FL=1|jgi:hypothetical protein